MLIAELTNGVSQERWSNLLRINSNITLGRVTYFGLIQILLHFTSNLFLVELFKGEIKSLFHYLFHNQTWPMRM